MCPILCDPMDTRLLHPWDFLGKSTRVGCHFLLQGIFLTQGSNPGLPLCRQTLYRLSHQGRRPRFNSWVRKIRWRRDRLPTPVFLGFPCGSDSKESTCNVGDLGSIPGLEGPLEKGKATNSSILAWRIPWTVYSVGLQRVGHDWATFTSLHFGRNPTKEYWGHSRIREQRGKEMKG